MAVTRDATSGIWYPATSAEVTALYSGRGISAPIHGYNCQDTAGNLADFIGSLSLVKFNAPQYHVAVPGHTRLAIGYQANNDCHFVSPVTAGDVGDISNVSSTILIFGAAANGLGTAPPTAVKDMINFGASPNDRHFQWNASSKFQVVGTGQATGTGSASPGNSVHPVIFEVNRAGSAIVIQSDQESVLPTYTAPSGGSAYLSIGPDAVGDAGATITLVTYMLMWAGTSAEFTATQRASILDCHLNGPAVTSIAVTPTSFSIAPLATQQMTAIATRADGTTYDCTATATWVSSSPSFATVSATGLVTGVTGGTTNITASFTSLNAATATSPVQVVTVTGGGVTLTSISINNTNVSLRQGQTLQLIGRSNFSDGSHSTGASVGTWVSSNTGVVTVTTGVGGGFLTSVAPGTATITLSFGGFTATAFVVITIPLTDENEHHPWPGVLRGVWDFDGSQVAWTGDRVLVARDGKYSLGASAFWNRNVADPTLRKRGIPAYLPLQTDVIPAVTGGGNNSYVETVLTSAYRVVINITGSTVTLDVFDRTNESPVNHTSFTGITPSAPRVMESAGKLIATWLNASPGDLMLTGWTGDGWSTPSVMVSTVGTYECAVATDGVHLTWFQTSNNSVYVGKITGTSAATYPYPWATLLFTVAGISSLAIGVAPDTSLCIAFGEASGSQMTAQAYPSDPRLGPSVTSITDSSFDQFGGLSVCSRGLKNRAGEYEWLVYWKRTGPNGAACISSLTPSSLSSLIEKRFNTNFVSKAFRVGDEVFIWAQETNASTLYLLGGQYKAQTCGFADREVGLNAPEDGVTAWLHQVMPDPLVSGESVGPYAIKKISGTDMVYDAGAASQQVIVADGYVTATATENNTFRWIAITSNFTLVPTFIEHGFRLRSDATVDVVDFGVAVVTSVPYVTGDKFVVRRTATGGTSCSISYEMNGTVLYTSTGVTMLPAVLMTLFFQLNATLSGVELFDHGVAVPITWQSVNVSIYSQASGYGPTKTGSLFTWARGFNTGQPYARPGNIRIGDMDFLPQLSTVSYGKGVYVSGSAVRCWDGTELGDAGFQSYPIVFDGVASSGGSLSAGNYLYRVYAVRYTKQGERFESAALTSAFIAATASQKITLTIHTLPCTNHSDVVLEVYRTEAGGTTFYLDGTVANDTTAVSVSYVSSLPDTTLRTKVADPHATGVGQVSELESWGPLGCAILAGGGDRIWGAGGQVTAGQVQFSKLHNDLFGGGFDDIAGFQDVDTELGRITSLGRLNDIMIAFEENKLYAIGGGGPDNDGNGSFGSPQIMLADGAISHFGTILTQMGLCYWGKGGPRMVSTDYQIANISSAVNKLTDTITPTGARVDFERQEVVWYTADGTAVLWNYLDGGNRWARWSGLPVVATSPSALAIGDGRLLYPSATANGDAGDAFEFRLKTGILQADKVLGGGTLFRSVGLVGTFRGPHTVRARLFYDGSPLWAEEWEWEPQTGTYLSLGSDFATLTPAQIDALKMISQSGAYITHKRTARNTCAYLQVEISDKGCSNPSFIPTEITLEVGVSPNLARVAPNTFKG